MIIKRILTGIVGIAVTAGIVTYGQWLFVIALAVLALAAWHEFYKILAAKAFALWYSMGIAAILLLLLCAWQGVFTDIPLLFLLVTLLCCAKPVFDSRFNIVDAALTALGVGYIGLTFAYLILLRFFEPSYIVSPLFGQLSIGTAFLWIALIGTWANDTAAFFVGSRFGKHKLCPAVSPGKTVEGAAGGIAGSVAAVVLLGTTFQLPLIHSVAIGLVIGLLAPVGDLAESALKRFAGVKDSGSVLPGHGGILDRFDSIMFVVPVIYYYMKIFLL